jgi:transposase
LPTGGADPLRTKRGAMLGVRWHRGRYLLGAKSPTVSLTLGPWSTPDCRQSVRWTVEHVYENALNEVPSPAVLVEDAMEVLYPRCAGLDVHKKTVVASVRIATENKLVTEVRTFPTTTSGLLRLSDWLSENGCTHVAMEATGVYWKPVWHVLSDGEFALILANAAHVKNVPGRKSDVSDAAWVSELLAHGLIRASFVPDTPTQEMRALLRTRKQLVRETTRHIQRIHKTLEDANIKLESQLSDILGKSGRSILDAMVAGETDPVRLAALAHPSVKCSQAGLQEALRGRMTRHDRFPLQLHLRQIDSLDAAIATINQEVEANLAPFRTAVELVSTIPGVSLLSAETIVAETGIDMSRFPTERHFLSWANMCPRNDESAGKRRSTRRRKGGNWLKTALIQCAWAAKRKKGSYLQAQFLRLRSRRGEKKAICAVAASILTATYHMLKNGTPYQDLGADHFNRRSKVTHTQRLVRRLEQLGYAVEIQPLPA